MLGKCLKRFQYCVQSSVSTEATEKEGWPGSILQRTNHGTGEDFRESKVPIATRAQTVVQGPRVNRASSKNMVSKPQGKMEAIQTGITG